MAFQSAPIVTRDAVDRLTAEQSGDLRSLVRSEGRERASLLIVEDEALVALSMAEMLTAAGYEVLGTVASGRAALEAVAKQVPDLILMDITLRGPMDGIETAQALRAIATVPILYVTAYSEGAIMDRAQATGPAGYLRKPFYGQQLEQAVAAALTVQGANRVEANC
ncbi:response regulator [Rhodospirillaceae bacterium SYSU D60014]|uniref:response regulator n=1 Tax=Virgifigura deserti TaxID=2268457 RepID=UPI0013C50809